jgi:hypothetical protein
MKIQRVAQTENYIKQNIKKIKIKNLGFYFSLFFLKKIYIFLFFVLFLYNFMKCIFVIVGHIDIVW